MGATMFSEGDIGVLPPLGVYDPLGLIETRDMRRYEIMEIKHGRAAMLGFLHVIAIEAGVRMPGYLSISQDLKFADVPAGCFASLEAVPTAGWLQIMVLTCMQEPAPALRPSRRTPTARPATFPSTRGCATTTPRSRPSSSTPSARTAARPCLASPAA